MWKVAQAAVKGRGHISSNTPCQDKTFYIMKQGTCAIALADGAGSARCSHLGAERSVEYISNLLIDNFEHYYNQPDSNVVRREILSLLMIELEKLAANKDCELRDLASTLLCVAVSRNRYIIIHLGDGVIGYRDEDLIKVASTPNNGEFRNSTVFTTSEGAEESLRLLKGDIRECIKGFVLFSDGVESIMYKQSKKEITQSLSPVFDDLSRDDPFEVEQNLVETLEEIKSHTLDDCSIIVMSKSLESNTTQRVECEESNSESSCKSLVPHRRYVPAIFIVVAILLVSIITLALAI